MSKNRDLDVTGNRIPLVSIIMPTFNRANYLPETLKSIENQTFLNWECLIIDDGSTDETRKILDPIINLDKRFKYFSRPNEHLKGPSGCRNYGIEISNGNYIIFFDSDDIINPRTLEICLGLLQNQAYQFCNYAKKPFYGEWDGVFETQNNIVGVREINNNNIEEITTQKLGFACCTVMWKRNALTGEQFNENLSYAEEWEYYIRLVSSNLKGFTIKNVLYHNRKHPNSNTGQFWNRHPARMKSKIEATKLVIDNLKEKKLFSDKLTQYFLQLGFQLKQIEIIKYTLKSSNSNFIKRIKYRLGYYFYPLIKPLLSLKSKFF